MLNQKQILNRRHWVFDMDGTLTVAAHNFDQIREELGLEPGIPIVKTLDSMPPEKANPLRERLQQIEIELAKQAEPAEGLMALLNVLQSKGCKLGIVTLNTKENAWITLEALGIEEYFEEYFVMGRSCTEPKPSPEAVQKMMQDGILTLTTLWSLVIFFMISRWEETRERQRSTSIPPQSSNGLKWLTSNAHH